MNQKTNYKSNSLAISLIAALSIFSCGTLCFADADVTNDNKQNEFIVQLMDKFKIDDDINNFSLKSVVHSDSSNCKHKTYVYEFDSKIEAFQIRNKLRSFVNGIAENNNLIIDRSFATLEPTTFGWGVESGNHYNLYNLVVVDNDGNKYSIVVFSSLIATKKEP